MTLQNNALKQLNSCRPYCNLLGVLRLDLNGKVEIRSTGIDAAAKENDGISLLLKLETVVAKSGLGYASKVKTRERGIYSK